MTSSRRNLTAGAVAMLLCVFVITDTGGTRAQEPDGNFGVGIPSVFLPKYLRYRAQQLNSGTPDVLRIRLGYVKGLSRSFTAMVGEAAVNLQSGAFNVSLNGLTPLQTYTVWLLDQTDIDTVPPVPDTVVGLVTFLATGPTRLLTGLLPVSLPLGFTIDRVAVVPGTLPGTGPLASGSVNVFQKIFFRRLSLVNESTGVILFQETTPAPALAGLVPDLAAQTDALASSVGAFDGPPTLGFASPSAQLMSSSPLETSAQAESSGGSVKLDKLISKGAELFFEETFKGNGRTCGSCHPASNNFTIDKDFIATLPANDPLFVAEFNPALAGLERPLLMKQFGLILENLDGLDNPTQKFVMRGVPHTLGLQVSLERDTSIPTGPPAEMTGWSGDGAPGTGSLRDFAIGAVTQHFTKRLARVVGQDFKLPKENQLDAMETFQLSLGRSKDFILDNINFTDGSADAGKTLFISGGTTQGFGGTCNFCHTNAGALAAAPAGQNRNFDTSVEEVPHPARDVQDFPIDGGFGQTPVNPDGGLGNRTFNTASVVEAADTAPFFHNNVVTKLEDEGIVSALEGVVRFYTGPQFSDQARIESGAAFKFTELQITQLVAFMRGVNTLQNIDVAGRELQEILDHRNNPRNEQDKRLQTAFDEIQDAIDVITEPFEGIFPAAVQPLTTAQQSISQAQLNTNPAQRRALVQQAIDKLVEARNAVATAP
jgi:cytochrome c peroxidase